MNVALLRKTMKVELILNADDLGVCPIRDEGIFEVRLRTLVSINHKNWNIATLI